MTDKVQIIFATRSGGSEQLAYQLKKKLQSAATPCEIQVSSIDDWFSDEESLSELLGEENTLFAFILTTAEKGSPPESASDFFDALQEWIEDEDEEEEIPLKFSVFGNGDSRYVETYQKFSRFVKKSLTKKTSVGNAVVECEEGDVSNQVEFDKSFEKWSQALIQQISSSK